MRTMMKRLIASTLLISAPAIADVRVTEKSNSGIPYEALLKGAWKEVPILAGNQRAYGKGVGTVGQILCGFKSDEPEFLKSIEMEPDWQRKFSRYFTDKLKNDPQSLLAKVMQSRPNFTLEDHYATWDSRAMKLTLVFSFDERAVVAGQALQLRVMGYETQVYAPKVFVQASCTTPFLNYSVETGKEMRQIRDSIIVGSPKK